MQFRFESLPDFWVMNGHGPYVWAAYGITAVVLAYLLISPLLQQKSFFRRQQKLQRKSRV